MLRQIVQKCKQDRHWTSSVEGGLLRITSVFVRTATSPKLKLHTLDHALYGRSLEDNYIIVHTNSRRLRVASYSIVSEMAPLLALPPVVGIIVIVLVISTWSVYMFSIGSVVVGVGLKLTEVFKKREWLEFLRLLIDILPTTWLRGTRTPRLKVRRHRKTRVVATEWLSGCGDADDVEGVTWLELALKVTNSYENSQRLLARLRLCPKVHNRYFASQ